MTGDGEEGEDEGYDAVGRHAHGVTIVNFSGFTKITN
jgi:hypothetical protein